MTTFFIALGVFGVAVAAMAVGVAIGGRRIKGSCGGLAGFTDSAGNSICDACSNPAPDCAGKRDGVARDRAANAGSS